jgi:hypothetical protein
MSVNLNAAGGISATNIQGMDLETMMMSVQSQRANLLEAQLKEQISSVQAKNEQISKLNTALGALNAIAAKFPTDKNDTKLSGTDAAKNNNQMQKDANSALYAAGITPGGTTKGLMNATPGVAADKDGVTHFTGGVNSDSKKSDIDSMIQTIKSQIDGMSNSQQMDMLRLQSLSNKRNEAFETMTNFIKKMQDNRSSIIGNMR